MKLLGIFLLPLDGMLVQRRSLSPQFVRFTQQFAGTHLYSWVERGTVRVKCLAQKHNTVLPVRARKHPSSSYFRLVGVNRFRAEMKYGSSAIPFPGPFPQLGRGGKRPSFPAPPPSWERSWELLSCSREQR